MTKKKRVSHLNYTLAGSSSNEQALDSNPNFIDDDDTCLCGRKLSEDYYKDVEDNCYVHMTQGY